MEHASGAEGAELPPGRGTGEDSEVAFDGPRFVRELAGALGMEPGQMDGGGDDSEEGSSFFSPRTSSESGSDAALQPGVRQSAWLTRLLGCDENAWASTA